MAAALTDAQRIAANMMQGYGNDHKDIRRLLVSSTIPVYFNNIKGTRKEYANEKYANYVRTAALSILDDRENNGFPDEILKNEENTREHFFVELATAILDILPEYQKRASAATRGDTQPLKRDRQQLASAATRGDAQPLKRDRQQLASAATRGDAQPLKRDRQQLAKTRRPAINPTASPQPQQSANKSRSSPDASPVQKKRKETTSDLLTRWGWFEVIKKYNSDIKNKINKYIASLKNPTDKYVIHVEKQFVEFFDLLERNQANIQSIPIFVPISYLYAFIQPKNSKTQKFLTNEFKRVADIAESGSAFPWICAKITTKGGFVTDGQLINGFLNIKDETKPKFEFTYEALVEYLHTFPNAPAKFIPDAERPRLIPRLLFTTPQLNSSIQSTHDDILEGVDIRMYKQIISIIDTYHDFKNQTAMQTYRTILDTAVVKPLLRTVYDYSQKNKIAGIYEHIQALLGSKYAVQFVFKGVPTEDSLVSLIEDKVFGGPCKDVLDYNPQAHKEICARATGRMRWIIKLGYPVEVGRPATGIYTSPTPHFLFKQLMDAVFGVACKFVIDVTLVAEELYGFQNIITTGASLYDGSKAKGVHDKIKSGVSMVSGELFHLESIETADTDLTIRPSVNPGKYKLNSKDWKKCMPSKTFPEDKLSTCYSSVEPVDFNSFLYDMKRAGDAMQVSSCMELKKTTPDIVFVTHDRLAMIHARVLGINVLFTKIENASRVRIVEYFKSATGNSDLIKSIARTDYNKLQGLVNIISTKHPQFVEIEKANNMLAEIIAYLKKTIDDDVGKLAPQFTQELIHKHFMFNQLIQKCKAYSLPSLSEVITFISENATSLNEYSSASDYAIESNRANIRKVLDSQFLRKLFEEPEYKKYESVQPITAKEIEEYLDMVNHLSRSQAMIKIRHASSITKLDFVALLNGMSQQGIVAIDTKFYLNGLDLAADTGSKFSKCVRYFYEGVKRLALLQSSIIDTFSSIRRRSPSPRRRTAGGGRTIIDISEKRDIILDHYFVNDKPKLNSYIQYLLGTLPLPYTSIFGEFVEIENANVILNDVTNTFEVHFPAKPMLPLSRLPYLDIDKLDADTFDLRAPLAPSSASPEKSSPTYMSTGEDGDGDVTSPLKPRGGTGKSKKTSKKKVASRIVKR